MTELAAVDKIVNGIKKFVKNVDIGGFLCIMCVMSVMKDIHKKLVGLLKRFVSIAACRLPLAACRLPLAACRLPLAAGHAFLAAGALTMASGLLTMRGAARRGFGLFAFAIFGALTLSVALADKASAQQSPSVTYAAYPADLVSITAEGALVVLQQPETGVMTATIVGTSFIFVDGAYIRNPAFTPGERYMTLRFISSCSIKDGCDGFGLNGLADTNARIAAFRAMDITTMRQFAASGADLNERPSIGNASGALLYILAQITVPDGEAHPALARMSVLVNAGANVNSQDNSGNTMLHSAATNGATSDILMALLAMPGIAVNITDIGGRTPLDEISGIFFTAPAHIENARLLREAGGECRATNKTSICQGQ